MLSSMVLAVALLASEPVLQPTSAATDPIAADSARVKRFMGALLGGAVGVAVPLAMTAAFSSCGTSFVGAPSASCLSTAQYALIISSAFLGPLGAMAGYALAGGSPSIAAFGAVIPAALMTLAVMALTSEMSGMAKWVPGMVAGASVLALASAILLTWREDQVTAASESFGRDVSADAVRVALTVVTSASLALVGAFVAALTIGSSTVAAIAIIGALGLAQSFSAYAVHRVMGGRAPGWAPLLAFLLEATGGAMVALAILAQSGPTASVEGVRNQAGQTVAVTGAGIALAVVPTLIFEAFHTAEVESDGLDVRVGGGPIPGGAIVTVGLTL